MCVCVGVRLRVYLCECLFRARKINFLAIFQYMVSDLSDSRSICCMLNVFFSFGHISSNSKSLRKDRRFIE